MRSIISRWFLFGLLLGWSLTHATVFGQSPTKSSEGKATSTQDKLRQGLERAITVDYSGASLVEVLNHIRDRSGINITLDEQALLNIGIGPDGNDGFARQFQVKARDQKASVVLRNFLANYRLCYVVFEDSLLVTTEEMAVLRQLRQRVNVNLEEVPARTAIRDLARSRGINVVIDPKVLKQAETPVTLQLDNTGIETAMRLMAELASLKAVRMGNVMFVTSEEKAKRIREEEKEQFDNPFNPGNPAVDRPIIGIGGGFGMIGGGAVPRAVPPGIAVPGNPGIAIPEPGIPVPPNVDPPPGRPDGQPPMRGGDTPAAPVKKVIPVPQAPQAPPQPPAPPGLDRPSSSPAVPPRRDPNER